VPEVLQTAALSLWDARRSLGTARLYVPIVVVFLGFGLFEPVIFSPANLRNVGVQASYLLIFTTAQALVLLTRGFDLSIGMGVSFVSLVAALTIKDLSGAPPFVAIACGISIGLLVGALIGAINGVLVSLVGINPFVVTLGTSNILLALNSTISGGFPIAGLPNELTRLLAEGALFGVPIPIATSAVVLAAVHIMLEHRVYGRRLYLIGSNPRAAKAAGVPVTLCLLLVYMLCAALAAVGAILMTARTGAGEPNLGGSLALQTIAAAVIGGVSLRGGEGGVVSVLLGAVLITVMSNGMDLARVDGYLQQVFFGLIIIGSLALDRYGAPRTRGA
jgi:ribose transport system permease protein